MEANSRDKRKYPRYEISEEVMIALLIPDQTFTPFSLRGEATDISLGGVRIKTYQLKKKDYLALIQSMCPVKVRMEPATVKHPIELKGRVVWSDYHEESDKEPAHCFLGIAFYKFTEDAIKDFMNVFERVDRSATSERIPKELTGKKLGQKGSDETHTDVT